ncbi:glycoside hydrolase family 18 protein [Pelomyxa schiedti]|nr:glycoside hydrolase family 18 protein [Pelomyxa schiedti]
MAAAVSCDRSCLSTRRTRVWALVFVGCVAALATADETVPFAVVGYVPEWRYSGINWNQLAQRTTHLILFSIEASFPSSYPSETPQELQGLAALDRLPPASSLGEARAAADEWGTKLLVCIGGNARSAALGPATATAAARGVLARSLAALCAAHGLDGVDLNWEYPRDGAQWRALFALVGDLRASLPSGSVVTMALYPGQERLITSHVASQVDLFHMMAYDNVNCNNPPCHHSSYDFAAQVVHSVSHLPQVPSFKFTLGLPFYSRHHHTGNWVAYYDIDPQVRSDPELDHSGEQCFNGANTLINKVNLAKQSGLGGIMIWEVGQDIFPQSHNSLLDIVWCATQQQHSQQCKSPTQVHPEL